MPEILLKILPVWLFLISVFAVGITIDDKIRAKKRAWRIPEATLFGTALLGGSLAMYCTMLIIRHKTRHLSFMVGIPLIILGQAALAWYLLPA